MKMLYYALIVGALSYGCSCSSFPTIAEKDMADAILECHQENGSQHNVRWSDIPQRDKDLLLRWIANSPMSWNMCFTTYVPILVIRTKKFNINFVGDLVVCNYETDSGVWKQVSRKMDADDKNARKSIIRIMKESRVSDPPIRTGGQHNMP